MNNTNKFSVRAYFLKIVNSLNETYNPLKILNVDAVTNDALNTVAATSVRHALALQQYKICPYCDNKVSLITEDYLSWCDECEVMVEGYYGKKGKLK